MCVHAGRVHMWLSRQRAHELQFNFSETVSGATNSLHIVRTSLSWYLLLQKLYNALQCIIAYIRILWCYL